jgi:hypothetical protein
MMKGENMLDEDVERLLASRKEAGLKIDPETAEVCADWGPVGDPYGVYSAVPEQSGQVGRRYFARSPGSDIWVHFWDLPDETREVLERHKSELASAGLEQFLQQS